MGAASSRDQCALDDAISRQDAAPTSIFQGHFVPIPKVEQSAHGRPVKSAQKGDIRFTPGMSAGQFEGGFNGLSTGISN